MKLLVPVVQLWTLFEVNWMTSPLIIDAKFVLIFFHSILWYIPISILGSKNMYCTNFKKIGCSFAENKLAVTKGKTIAVELG